MSFSLSHGKTLDVGHIGVSSDDLPPFEAGAIDLRGWFGPERCEGALELEIGSGKGTFLVQQAPLTPGVNYIGVEYAAAFWRYAADRCRRHGLENVRIVRAEAAYFVRNYVPSRCFSQVHIYFPDPWPKKRHHKRRLIQEPFLRLLHGKLIDRAPIRIATDHAGYFEWIQDHAAAAADMYEQLPFAPPDPGAGAGPGGGSGELSADDGELIGTNFERKYRREGRQFYGLVLRKR